MMPTIQQELEPLLLGALGANSLRSVVKTLPITTLREPGSLDVVEVRELLGHLEASLRLFSSPSRQPALSVLRSRLNGGKLARPRVERLSIRSDSDVLATQRLCQQLNRGLFGATDCVRLATAASELARNIYMYAGQGTVTLRLEEEAAHFRFEILAEDQGPGIPHLEVVLSGSYTSKTGLGRGLVGTKALVDELTIDTAPGKGTRVRAVRRTRKP